MVMTDIAPRAVPEGGFYFDDIEIGTTAVSGWLAIDEAHMITFAREWDPMPMHIDRKAAQASIFGGITASSIYTFGLKQLLIKHLLTESAVVCMLGFTEGRLPVALHAGRSVRLEARWLTKRMSGSHRGCGVVSFAIRLLTDRDETVLDFVETILLRQRPD